MRDSSCSARTSTRSSCGRPRMSVMMLTAKPGNIYYMDSFAFPKGYFLG